MALEIKGRDVFEELLDAAALRRYQWFGRGPRNLTSGSDFFVLAVDWSNGSRSSSGAT